MEVKPGYKRTEMGVIPEDWEAEHLGNIAEVVMGQSPVGTSYNQDALGVPLINGPTEFTDRYPIRKQWTTKPTKICKKGDLLLCVRGSSTGRTNISDDEYCIGRGIAAVRAKPGADTRFVTLQIDSAVQQLLSLRTGSTFPSIDGKSIRSIPVVLPPLCEQQAIADMLSDVDALIAALDRLIAKKRAIKLGAMQQLLSGKTRLPGFGGRWETTTFGECFDFLPTGSNPRRELSDTGDVKYIHYGDIHTRRALLLDCSTESLPCISAEKVANLPRLQEGDLIIADASEDLEGTGVSVEVTNTQGQDVVAGLHTILLRGDKSRVADGFKAYITSTRMVREQLVAIATGISVFGISKTHLATVKLALPPTTKEQRAIAAVLSDMDAEIAALEARRDKMRALKQGMMQELLTGRTRLV